ncbi:MAG: pyridoxamine 5'-phosphate oxidase family protein [Syntrophobacteraceae bacterium]|jgi:nitroimidazol reductase NimA-like FMN-containing flavoprotein (pyridoxamine 5'-phosphate oxidase superfamily)
MSAKETMVEVIGSHNLVHIATVDSAGMPCVRGVDYAAADKENILYFVTRKDSQKIGQIAANSNIAFAIDEDCPEWKDLAKLKYIKGTGTATLVKDPVEAQTAFGLLMKKFPFLSDLPGDPSNFAVVKVELKKVLVSDNTISFGHTEEVNF